MNRVDVLVVGAHPDDAEIGVGGLIHKLTTRGRSVGILDLTRGENASRGTVDERQKEALEAARILGVAARENAGLPDGGVANTPEQRERVIQLIREFRPTTLIAPLDNDRHPDHDAAHALLQDAAFLSGLEKIETGQAPQRPKHTYYYRVYGETTLPNLVIDITEHFDTKLQAMKAHASQLYNPSYAGPETYVASKAFWDAITLRASYWGDRVGVTYGEPLYAEGPLLAELPPGLE